MDVFHIQVVCRDGIRDGVRSESLRLFDGIPDCQKQAFGMYSRCHELRIKFNRVIAKFRSRDRFKTLTALRQV
jgi:hypothetical protein